MLDKFESLWILGRMFAYLGSIPSIGFIFVLSNIHMCTYLYNHVCHICTYLYVSTTYMYLESWIHICTNLNLYIKFTHLSICSHLIVYCIFGLTIPNLGHGIPRPGAGFLRWHGRPCRRIDGQRRWGAQGARRARRPGGQAFQFKNGRP